MTEVRLTLEHFDGYWYSNGMSQNSTDLGVPQRSSDHSLVHFPESSLSQLLLHNDVVNWDLPFICIGLGEASHRVVYFQSAVVRHTLYYRNKEWIYVRTIQEAHTEARGYQCMLVAVTTTISWKRQWYYQTNWLLCMAATHIPHRVDEFAINIVSRAL